MRHVFYVAQSKSMNSSSSLSDPRLKLSKVPPATKAINVTIANPMGFPFDRNGKSCWIARKNRQSAPNATGIK